jgi:putative nucleotidyltransferase with HDIG domain
MLSLYVRLVIAAGGAAVLQALVGLGSTPHPLEWLSFATLVILTGSFTLNIAAINASVSVADTFLIASTLLFGPAPATVALAVDTFVLSWRKGYAWQRVAFNAVAPAASIWAAGHAFFLVSGATPLAASEPPIGPLIPALILLAGLYFLLNSGLIAVAVALESKRSPVRIWYEHFLWLSIGYFAAASVALALIVVERQAGFWAVAMMLPLVAIFHHTLRASFGRLEDARLHVRQIDRLYRSTVETLAMAIDAKDDVTHSHVRRVQTYAGALARALDVHDEQTLKAIDAAALLHDTGKLAIPERILNKPGGLTPSEFEQMKRHVEIGANILSLVEFPYPVVPIVRCHHENWDGSGYPAGVTGTDIPIGARILSVVDCFDALTSDRPYRRRLSTEAALQILRDRRGTMYDPEVVDTFIRIHAEIAIAESDDPDAVEVWQQINRSLQGEPPPLEPALEAALRPGVGAADEVSAFASLARLASGNGSRTDIFAVSGNLLHHLCPEASGALYLVQHGCDRLEVVHAFGPSAVMLRQLFANPGERLTGWVAANRQPIVRSDAALDLGQRAFEARPQLVGCMSVPLVVGETLVGVLTLYSPTRDAFQDVDRLVLMIAPQLAAALHATVERRQKPQHLKLVASDRGAWESANPGAAEAG